MPVCVSNVSTPEPGNPELPVGDRPMPHAQTRDRPVRFQTTGCRVSDVHHVLSHMSKPWPAPPSLGSWMEDAWPG